MRLIVAEVLFDKVGNIKPRSQRQHDDIGNFMNMITNSPTVDAIPLSVIENIKSEINELSKLDHIEPTYEDCKRDVLEIIEKYISGAKEGNNGKNSSN